MESNPNLVYHLKPRWWEGDVIYPLADLQKMFPHQRDKWASTQKAYDVREKRQLSFCLSLGKDLSQVIHLTFIHPDLLRQHALDCGLLLPPLEAFVIDLARLNPGDLAIYRELPVDAEKSCIAEYSFFGDDKKAERRIIPEATEAHWRSVAGPMTTYDLFRHTTVLLHRGPVRVNPRMAINRVVAQV